jgi:hypothetical protein
MPFPKDAYIYWLNTPLLKRTPMQLHVYTSQSRAYFDSIGKYSLASALEYLPPDARITVTTEDAADFPQLNSRIQVVDLYGLDNGFREFEDRWRGRTMAKVINFAKKGYTVLWALEHSTADIMIWLDADAYFERKVDAAWAQGLLRGNLGAQMGVTHDDGEFTVESGFFLMDLHHPGRADFARFYRDYYDNDRCENMGRFYDSNVHGHALRDCERAGHTFTEMNLRQKGNTPLKGSMIHGWVGHFKGKVKNGAATLYAERGIGQNVQEVLS